MISSDSEAYGNVFERYLAQPSMHDQGGGGGDEDVEMAPPPLNQDSPTDFDGAPIGTDYLDIPVEEPWKDLISIKIRKTSFVRQEVHFQPMRLHYRILPCIAPPLF
jgi:hypothetical protein